MTGNEEEDGPMTDESRGQRYKEAIARRLQGFRHAVAARVTCGAHGLRRGCASMWTWSQTVGAPRAKATWRRAQDFGRDSVLPFLRRYPLGHPLIFRRFLRFLVGAYDPMRRAKTNGSICVGRPGQNAKFC